MNKRRVGSWTTCFCIAFGCADQGERAALLERSVRDPYRCEVTSELRDFGLNLGSAPHSYSNDVVQLGDDLWLEHVVGGAGSTPDQLVLEQMSRSGEIGTSHVVDANVARGSLGSRTLVALGEGLALLWLRSTDGKVELWFAAFDPAGSPTIAPHAVNGVEPGSSVGLKASASSADHVGVVLAGSGNSRQFVVLDATGERLGPAREDRSGISALRAASDGGFVMLQIRLGTREHPSKELMFLKTDELGEPEVEAARIARVGADHLLWGASALVPIDGGYLAAWSEARVSQEDEPWRHPTGSYATILLRRLNPSGLPLGDAQSLRAQRDSLADHSPVLAPFADSVALFWSSGPYNYDCEMPEACSHRDRGQLILLDPRDLAPRSELLEVLRDPAYPNGSDHPRLGDLLAVALHPRDDEILVTATLEDDNDARIAPGFASLRCR